MKTIIQLLAEELGCKEEYVNNVVTLLDEGNTIPFIARYRKEAHGAMDDTTLRTLETRLGYLRNLQTRREEVKASIDAQGKLTDELSAAIDRALTLAEVEDLYRPYKQKRRTRATVAKEKGLEPLAQAIFEQQMQMNPPEVLAKDYINPDLGVETIEDALAGASDIIAERNLGRRRASEKPAHHDAEAGGLPEPGGKAGRGLCVPALLCVRPAGCKIAEPPDSCAQPRRKGRLS